MEKNASTSPSPRMPLVYDVDYQKRYARQFKGGTLFNISLSGAFLKHPKGPLGANEKIVLVFHVSGRRRKITATVVWGNEAGSGVRFVFNSKRDEQMIDDLIYFVESSRDSKKSVLDDIFKQVS